MDHREIGYEDVNWTELVERVSVVGSDVSDVKSLCFVAEELYSYVASSPPHLDVTSFFMSCTCTHHILPLL